MTAKLYCVMAEVISHKEPAPMPSEGAIDLWRAAWRLQQAGAGPNDAGVLLCIRDKIDAMLEDNMVNPKNFQTCLDAMDEQPASKRDARFAWRVLWCGFGCFALIVGAFVWKVL